MSIKGNQLTALVRVEGYPKISSDGKSKKLEDRFVCKWSSWQSLVPAIGSTTDQLVGVYLKEISVDRDGEAANIALLYSYPDPVEPGVDGGDTYESRAAVTVDEYGNRKPAVTWTRRMRKSVFEMSAANLTSNVGKRVDPPGMISPTANEWLKVGREVSQGADFTEITDTYEWKAEAWKADYGNGTET